jgi:hypothetical protein
MRQFDMVFIQNLNKFRIVTKNKEDIEFIILIFNGQLPNNFTIIYLFYKNKLVQKHNENVFINTLGPTFIFKATMPTINHQSTLKPSTINHQSCPPSYKLSNDLSKNTGLHFTII